MAVAVLAVPAEEVLPEARPSFVFGVAGVDPAVDVVGRDTLAAVGVGVLLVQRQVLLVDPVEPQVGLLWVSAPLAVPSWYTVSTAGSAASLRACRSVIFFTENPWIVAV